MKQMFNVLIVDDSNFFRLTVRKMIEANFKVKIFEAANAFEGMRVLGNNLVDIILLDVNMPEVDGFKAAKIIKHQEKYSQIPIIFCTAMPPTDDVILKSFEVGGIDFLNKPFTEADLVRILSLYFRFILRERDITSKLKENQKKLQLEIEERKLFQKALSESEEKFRKIRSSAYDAIVMINEENKITFWNEAAYRIFGYTSKEVGDIDFIKLVAPPGKYQLFKLTFDNMKRLTKEELSVNSFELTCIKKAGFLIDLDISISVVHIGASENFIFIARDITQRKREAQMLERSESMLAAAEATAHIGSWEYDVNTHTTTWSKELYNIYAVDPNEQTASIEIIQNMMKPQDSKMFEQFIENAVVTGEPFVMEAEITSADGKTKIVEGRARAIADADGKVQRLVGTLMDITEKKLAIMKIEKYLEELQESNATKDKFCSIIAHDLRNPFGALKNLTEILSDMYDDFTDEERRELSGEMKKSASNLFELLENLLTWSRSQRGIITFVPDDVYLYQLAANTIDLLHESAGKKNIKVINDIPEDFMLECDHNMISTVIRNITSNAIKFTPENGQISISCENLQSETKVIIEDNGVGISEEDIQKLFKIGIHHSTIGTGSEKGTGLGLILCKEFIMKHNGEIWVESELGKGSKFIFTLPNQV